MLYTLGVGLGSIGVSDLLSLYHPVQPSLTSASITILLGLGLVLWEKR